MNSRYRDMVISGNFLNPSDVNGAFTFFYDESINVRKFRIKSEDTYNNPIDQDFVLGGLMIKASQQKELPEINMLIKCLNLQSSMNEIKCEHIVGKVDFLNALKSQRLKEVLSWIVRNELWIHCRSTNYFYYGLVDIIDSYATALSPDESKWAKNALWKVFKGNLAAGTKILFQFAYPNVGKENEVRFYKKIRELYMESTSILSKAEIDLLNIVFSEAIKKPSCPFLYANTDLMVQDSFTEFYTEPVWLFCNSMHIFDEEKTIKPKMDMFFQYPGNDIQVHYNFCNSTESYSLQLSDVMVGILGKLFKYVEGLSSFDTFLLDWRMLSAFQKDNFNVLSRLICRSMIECPPLINRVQPIDTVRLIEKILFFVSDALSL